MSIKIVPKPLSSVSQDALDLTKLLAAIPDDEQSSVIINTLYSLANTQRNRQSQQYRDYLMNCCEMVEACDEQGKLNWHVMKDNLIRELNDVYTACGLSLYTIAECRMSLFFVVLAEFAERRNGGKTICEDYKKLQKHYSLDLKYVITLMVYHEFIIDRIEAVRSIYKFFDDHRCSCCQFVRMYPDRYEKTDKLAHLMDSILVAIERLNALKNRCDDEMMRHDYSIEISVLKTRLLELL
tara:strand:- start:10470 stop:11186 length:717 start_codon:yes stop_codon:yes gene_type:complete